MDYAIGFILGFVACGLLWALRERERRQAFEDAADALDAQREENKRLHAREQHYLQGFAYFKDGMRELRHDLGGEVTLPAAAGQSRQHFSLRTTARLNGAGISGPSRNGGPGFSGGRQ